MKTNLILFVIFLLSSTMVARPIIVGSKIMMESRVLGEIITAKLRQAGIAAEHKTGMGGTLILWQALQQGVIDIYPEFTGTIKETILHTPGVITLKKIRELLHKKHIGITKSLGFQNNYALVVKKALAQQLKLKDIGDLSQHPQLRIGLTHEFLQRHDGWHGLRQLYNLTNSKVSALDHNLGYLGLQSGDIDVKEAYTTDYKINHYDLHILTDNRNYFPAYQAVLLYQQKIPHPVIEVIDSLVNKISTPTMIQLNAIAQKAKDPKVAAQAFITGNLNYQTKSGGNSVPWSDILQRTYEHVILVIISLFFSVLVGVPLGIIASNKGALSQVIFNTTGIIQTIPSLALLAMFVPIFGISWLCAIAALFLYGLLPIVRSTAIGLQTISLSYQKTAIAMGLPYFARLRLVLLPLALPTILSGIKTSAIISIGVATLAAFIGVGGLGELILSGITLNDYTVLLSGAIPTAVLSICAQTLFVIIDSVVITKALKTNKVI